MRVISIVGARPQIIKLAEVDLASKSFFEHKILHTGQHYDKNMSDVFFKEMNTLNKNLNLDELSMGMSSDYLNAIKNSATYVRIGSKIFGERS